MFLSLFVPEPKVSVDATRRDDYRVSPQVFFWFKVLSRLANLYLQRYPKVLKHNQVELWNARMESLSDTPCSRCGKATTGQIRATSLSVSKDFHAPYHFSPRWGGLTMLTFSRAKSRDL